MGRASRSELRLPTGSGLPSRQLTNVGSAARLRWSCTARKSQPTASERERRLTADGEGNAAGRSVVVAQFLGSQAQ